jgi:hypothetical protein
MNHLHRTSMGMAAALWLTCAGADAACWRFEDCNNNGIHDARELVGNDCNRNGVPDECDPDLDGDGRPDDCEVPESDLDCGEFDRTELLTPEDTLTLVTNFHNPELEQGYLIVTAVDETGEGICFDRLIGNSVTVHGLDAFDCSINPIDYTTFGPEGSYTDIDLDGIADLNGIEYDLTAGQILIPRFLGQIPGRSHGELIFIALSGGRLFDTVVDLLVYNDNEVAFSTEHAFRCWDRVALTEISPLFDNDWLATYSGDDADESVGGLETGWIRIDGGMATSRVKSIIDPAVYAVYISQFYDYTVADLPFETSLQRGHLLPNSLFGDNEEQGGGDQIDGISRGRREPGSLLLYPEFDNRDGVVSLITVTNTHPTKEVRVHFQYIGRFGN